MQTDRLAREGEATPVDERVAPWEHDAGPTTASGWAALIAETPNYLQ